MKYVLLVQTKRLMAYQLARGRYASVATFQNTSEGVAEFSHFLQQQRTAELIVLLDLDDEQFHLQKIPRVSRRDQKSILRHHQRKLFGESPYACGMVASRKNNTDSKLEVTQIGLPADMDGIGWLASLNNANAHIRSYHWMSLLLYPLAQAAGMSANLVVMLVRLDADDDRIMVFREGRPLICRRFAEQSISSIDPEESGSVLAERVMQTFSYLEKITDSVEPGLVMENSVSVIAVGGILPSERESVDRQLNKLGVKPVVAVTLSTLADHMYGKSPAPESLAELVTRSVLRQKAYSYSLIFRGAKYLRRRVRHAMHAVSVSLLVGAAIAPAASRYVENDFNRLESLATDIERQTMQLRQAHLRPAWSNQFTVEAIRESVAHVQALEQAGQSTPFHFLASLSEQLTRHPKIELTSIRWTSADSDLIDTANVTVEHQRGTRSNSVSAARSVDQFTALVTGTVDSGPEGRASALNRFRSFVASIRESAVASAPGSEVTIVKLPFTENNSTFQTARSAPGRFALEVYSSRLVR